MPQISSFFGILIFMYYDDHNPPHFHALYNEFKEVRISDLVVMDGLPPRAMGLVVEWASLHQEELAENWKRSQKMQPMLEIKPLE
jgi:hypothetical protein